MKLPLRLIEQWSINVFNCRRLQIQQLDRRLHCVVDTGEKDQTQTFLVWQRRNFQLSGANRGESSFAARENFVQIFRCSQKTLDTVTGPTFDSPRRPSLGPFRTLTTE